MKRSLIGLLLPLCAFTACKDTPPGQMEPIPRPPGYVEPPKEEAPKPAAAPAPDPNKVVLRWNLVVDTPVAFRLEGTPESTDSKAPAAAALRTTYALQRPREGDYQLRFTTEGAGATQDQGTVSERGFVLDGLNPSERNLATLWLELPRDPVAIGNTWALGADLVDVSPLGPDFVQKKAERRNSVKLTALIPEADDKVATVEYDLHELVTGSFPPSPHALHTIPAAPAKPADKKKGKKETEEHASQGPREVTATVTIKGRGDFLVKAGRWRSWQGTLTAKQEGYTPKTPNESLVKVPTGTFKLQLTALDSVPAELQQPAAKK
ncbi:hypothetical protein [Hyalangium rubrum]|uniref:Lipoprotein n=1 Tax=Hyalangium rubrum TaxID=3103134 RepID=A0ABU5H7N8_9BACT|nr:hypothetical protein [Hyalangium sp. s54d21]MDY7229119.1 hypothetical protein [Hyalangium sp. s54d21]